MVHVRNDDLRVALHSLTRWELDALPLVSRQFSRITMHEGPQNMRPQRRMLVALKYSLLSTFIIVESQVVNSHPRVFMRYQRKQEAISSFATDYFKREYPDYPYWCQRDHVKIKMNNEELLSFIRGTPLLRFFTNTLITYPSGMSPRGVSDAVLFAEANHLATVWEGCTLIIDIMIFKGPRSVDFGPYLVPMSAPLLGNCRCLRLQGKIKWKGAALGEVASGTRHCPRIHIEAGVEVNLSAEHIADYLFSAIDDDAGNKDNQMRVLEDRRRPWWQQYESTSSSRLKQLIQERLESVSPRVPTFLLWIPYMRAEGTTPSGEFELLPRSREELPSNSKSEDSSCLFVSKVCETLKGVVHVVKCGMRHQIEPSLTVQHEWQCGCQLT